MLIKCDYSEGFGTMKKSVNPKAKCHIFPSEIFPR